MTLPPLMSIKKEQNNQAAVLVAVFQWWGGILAPCIQQHCQ